MKKQPRFSSSSLNLSDSAYANIGNPSFLQNTLSFTLESWVFLEDISGTQAIISKHSNDDTGAFLLYLDNGYPATYYRTAPYFLKSTDAITPNAWHHIAASYDSSKNQLTLYVDGVQKAQGSFQFKPSTSSPDDILIGADGGSQPTSFFQGMIGRIAIWTSCRTLDQIVSDSVQVDEPTAEAFLDACFDFSVLPAKDLSGNNLPISLYGGANYCQSVPGVKLENKAYVSCGHNPDLSFPNTESYTIEGWFFPKGDSGTIVSKFNKGGTGEYSLTLNQHKLSANRNTPPGTITSQAIIESNYSYYHFAMVFNHKDKTLNLYVNGNLQASQYFLENIPDDNTDFLIGAIFNQGTPDDFFEGYVQNIRVWDKALSIGEIQQWMLNQPVEETHLKASFDFSVNPPVDNTDQHTITLKNGAVMDFQKIILDPSDDLTKIGFFETLNATYLSQEKAEPNPPPSIEAPVSAQEPTAEILSESFSQTLQDELEHLMGTNNYDEPRKAEHRTRFKESFKQAQKMMAENPDLMKGFTTIRKQGRVKLIHHGLHGNEVIYEGDALAVSDCTLWWISFIYKLTIGFLQALGLVPTFGNIATRVYNLVSSNQRVIDFISTTLGKAITVSTGVSIVGVIYREGLMWPLLKLAFTTGSWWCLFWVLKKVIAIVTGLEAAELLAGFVVWAAQITTLSLQFSKACPQNAVQSAN